MFFFLRLVARAKELNNLQLPIAQLVKNLPAMRETWVQSLGWEDPLEKGKATHSSIVPWRILWTVVHGLAKSQTPLSDFHFHFCLVAQSCPTLCSPWTVAHQAPLSMGILQARILEWVAMPSSRGSSQPRDQTQVSCVAGRFFTV